MTEKTALSLEEVERLPLEVFSERAYLEYSMYVILDQRLSVCLWRSFRSGPTWNIPCMLF